MIQYCENFYIRQLALFGSEKKITVRPDYDIDQLVELNTAHIPGFMGIVGMEVELAELIGLKVDLRSTADLTRCFRDEVIPMAQVQYAVSRPDSYREHDKCTEFCSA